MTTQTYTATMKTGQIIGCLLVLLANVMSDNISCTLCSGAPTIDDCVNFGSEKCGQGEQCFLEKETTHNLNVVYNAGCRSGTVCNIMTTLANMAGRRDLSRPSRNLVNCAQCCSSDDSCNSRLCGEKPTVDTIEQCLMCDHLVSSPGVCDVRDVCPDKQVCYASIHVLGGNQIRYKFGCQEYHICQALAANDLQHRRDADGVVICDACCLGDECNKNDCFALKKSMVSVFGVNNSTTPKPTTPQPVTPKPTTPKPTIPKPTTPKPTTPSTTPKPTTPKPTTPSTTTPKPTTPKPTTHSTTTPKPTTPKPTTPKPTTPKPTTPKPTTPSTTTPTPTTPKPTTPKPTTPKPTNPSTAASTVPSVPSTAAPTSGSSGSSKLPTTIAPSVTII